MKPMATGLPKKKMLGLAMKKETLKPEATGLSMMDEDDGLAHEEFLMPKAKGLLPKNARGLPMNNVESFEYDSGERGIEKEFDGLYE